MYSFVVFVVVALCTVNAFKICNTNNLKYSMITKHHNALYSSNTMLKMSSNPIEVPAIVAKADASASSGPSELVKKLKVGSLFGLWYVLNIAYNIYNKKVLNLAPKLTYFTAFLQLAIGILYVVPKWELNKANAPVLTNEEIKNLLPVAICHLLTHVGAIVSLGAGAVSFTHIVKAAEPAVSAALSAVF